MAAVSRAEPELAMGNTWKRIKVWGNALEKPSDSPGGRNWNFVPEQRRFPRVLLPLPRGARYQKVSAKHQTPRKEGEGKIPKSAAEAVFSARVSVAAEGSGAKV